MKAAKPTNPSVKLSAPSSWAAITGITPLIMSPSRAMAAAFLPPKRSTLVAPGLLEPRVRGSGSPMSLQTMMALESEPSR